MKPVLDYRGRAIPPDPMLQWLLPQRRPICGIASLSLFAVTLLLFLVAWSTNSQQSHYYRESPFMALGTIGTAAAGLILGVVGLRRNERLGFGAAIGVFLNGAWLVCAGLFLLFAFAIFGRMHGSGMH